MSEMISDDKRLTVTICWVTTAIALVLSTSIWRGCEHDMHRDHEQQETARTCLESGGEVINANCIRRTP